MKKYFLKNVVKCVAINFNSSKNVIKLLFSSFCYDHSIPKAAQNYAFWLKFS